MSSVKPLPKSLFEEAKKLKITKISLEFQGGGDEGQWYVGFDRNNEDEDEDESYDNDVDDLERKIEDWAYEAYSYSGDGDDHGFDIMYDLVNMEVTHEYWYMDRKYEEKESGKISINEEED